MHGVSLRSIISGLLVSALFLLFSACTGTGSTPISVSQIKPKGNGNGYAGLIRDSNFLPGNDFWNLAEQSQTNLHNYGAQLCKAQADFSGEGFSRYWGGDAYLSVDASASLDLAASDFTIETRVKFTAIGPYNRFLTRGESGQQSWILDLTAGDLPNLGRKLSWLFWWSPNGKNTRYLGCNAQVEKERWYHVAITREGEKLRLFVDGKICAQTATSEKIYSSSDPLLVARMSRLEQPQFIGSLKEMRVLKGLALYTKEFSGREPAAMLSPIAGPGQACLDYPDHCAGSSPSIAR